MERPLKYQIIALDLKINRKIVLKCQILLIINRIRLPEEAEIHASVFPVFGKVRVTGEIIRSRMFKDEKTLFLKGA